MKAVFITALLALACAPCLAADCAKLVQQACGQCHTERSRPLSEFHLTRQQWQEAIERTPAHGAAVPDENLQELLDCLARAHGASPREASPPGLSSRPTNQGRNNP